MQPSRGRSAGTGEWAGGEGDPPCHWGHMSHSSWNSYSVEGPQDVATLLCSVLLALGGKMELLVYAELTREEEEPGRGAEPVQEGREQECLVSPPLHLLMFC